VSRLVEQVKQNDVIKLRKGAMRGGSHLGRWNVLHRPLLHDTRVAKLVLCNVNVIPANKL